MKQKQNKGDRFLVIRINTVQQEQLKAIKKRKRTSIASIVRNYLEFEYLNAVNAVANDL